jgi:aspartyl-tRNA(Asn)/glutamyl-tRNA(Gln) amidotransferase subunit C
MFNFQRTNMPVTVADVEKIATLSRLVLSADEAEKFTGQLNLILEYVKKLDEVDTSDVTPMSHPNEVVNVLRADEVGESLPVEDALGNAPERAGNYFKVPKVVSR